MASRFLRTFALVAVFTLVTPTRANAWHEAGHMSAALIAYRQLGEADQKKLFDILKKHPHYDLHLAADVPADAKLDEWVMMRASIWPDWVRGPKLPGNAGDKIKAEFHQGVWHYINKPIKHFDGATEAEQAKIEANIADTTKKRGEVLKRLPMLVDGMKGKNDVNLVSLVSAINKPTINEAEARAIAVCWLLHLGGDIHQPLHAVSLFARKSPDGDAGGNGSSFAWGIASPTCTASGTAASGGTT